MKSCIVGVIFLVNIFFFSLLSNAENKTVPVDIEYVDIKVKNSFSLRSEKGENNYIICNEGVGKLQNAIVELSDIKVHTLAFPHHDIVSLGNKEGHATLSVAHGVNNDEFFPLRNKEVDQAELYATFAILNNDRHAITEESNSIYNAKQVAYRTYLFGNENFTSIYNNEWIYRGINGLTFPLPEMKVINTQDNNGDGFVNWQDAAYKLIEESRILAQKILDKKVKVSSPVINSIKNKMKILLDEPINLTGSPLSIIDDMKTITTPSWQECFLDLRTPRALLPI